MKVLLLGAWLLAAAAAAQDTGTCNALTPAPIHLVVFELKHGTPPQP